MAICKSPVKNSCKFMVILCLPSAYCIDILRKKVHKKLMHRIDMMKSRSALELEDFFCIRIYSTVLYGTVVNYVHRSCCLLFMRIKK